VENERIVRVLIEEHDKLSAYSWLILRDAHLVEEVLQEVGMLAIRKHDEINDEEHLRGWARAACRNLALNLIRKENRRPIPLSYPPALPGPPRAFASPRPTPG
jgi:DNA-directed RNA polymerase specialized sigma24 family protein